MWGLYGLFGLITELLNRLTQVRADKIDFLDDNVTSRAPSDTALSTANWPGTRADLVALIAQVSGNNPLTLFSGSSYSSNINVYNKLTGGNATAVHGFMTAQSTTGSGSNSGADWEDLLNVIGVGSLKLCVLGVTSAPTAGNWSARITIDGRVVLNASTGVGPYNPGVDDNTGKSYIGTIIFDAVAPYNIRGVTYEDMRFTSSCRIEVQRGNVNTNICMAYEYHLNV